MSKKKRRKPSKVATSVRVGDLSGEPEAPGLPKVPDRLGSPFRDRLSGLKKQLEEQAQAARAAPKPAPSPAVVSRKLRGTAMLTEDDKVALSLAMQGVKRIDHRARPERVVGTGPRIHSRTAESVEVRASVEDEARARLDALVAAEVNFRIEREGGRVSAQRVGLPPRVVRELARRTRVDETLDLHGLTQRQAEEAVLGFVKRVKRAGLDVVCIVHGKGVHSEGGLGVLRDVVISVLTGSAAPHVRAFVTAPEVLGGSGALLAEVHR